MRNSPRKKRDPSSSPPQRARFAKQSTKMLDDEELEDLVDILSTNVPQRTPEIVQKIHDLMVSNKFSRQFFSKLGDLPEENQLLVCKFLKLEDISIKELIIKEETSSNLKVFFILSGEVSIRVLRQKEVTMEHKLDMMAAETIWQLYGWFRAIGWDRSTSEKKLQEIWKGWLKEPRKNRGDQTLKVGGFELNKLNPVRMEPSRNPSFVDSPALVSMTPKTGPMSLAGLPFRPISRRNLKAPDNGSLSKRRLSQQSIVSERSIKATKGGFGDLASLTKLAIDNLNERVTAENTFSVSKKNLKTDLCFSRLNHYAPLESVVIQTELPQGSHADKDSGRSILVVENTSPDTQVTLLLSNLVNPFSLPDDLRQVYTTEFSKVNPDISSCSHSELASFLRMRLNLLERIIRPFDPRSFEDLVECHMVWYLGKQVRTLNPGEVFGERALEGKNIRTASAYTRTDCK